MKDILTQLYNLYSEQQTYPEGSRANTLMKKLLSMEEPLCAAFGTKYMNALAEVQADLSELYQKDAFLHGFYLGVDLMDAIYDRDHTSLPS